MGHVGHDVGETDDELSEIDDNEMNEADMMSDESHKTDEWWWVMNDDERRIMMSWMRSLICKVEDS